MAVLRGGSKAGWIRWLGALRRGVFGMCKGVAGALLREGRGSGGVVRGL